MQRKAKIAKTLTPPQTGAWNTANVRPDLESWHEKNLSEGFVFFRVGITDQSTPEQIVTIQNKIKSIDERANKINEKSGRRIPNQKPYFKYTMIEPDGSEKPLGGGWYLYTGWSDTDDPRFHKNSKEELKGKEQVYFRAKSAVQNSKVPNFSIQWKKVHRFYYKFPVADEVQQFVAGNKIIKLTGFT
jgi:hypothetical protein